MRAVLVLAGLFLHLPLARADDAWPAFRGGNKAGLARGKTLPDTWDTSRNVRWKADVPGQGWSSPIVWGDRVFLTTCVSDKKQADSRKGLYITDLQGKTPTGEHEWQVVCLDAGSGKLLWHKTAFAGKAPATIRIKNSLASETPVTDGKHVWAYFGNVGLACFTALGKEVWKEKVPARKMRMGWGTAASPALFEGKLYVVNDNEEESYLACLEGTTGKEVWRVKRNEKSNWATPFVWEHKERTEIVTAGSGKVISYDLEGKPLWELKGMSVLAIPTPFAVEDLLYVTSGYVADPFIKPVYAIKPGAKGDISLKSGASENDFIVWSQAQAGPYHPTPVVHDGLLYVLYDRGFLACYEAKTGKEVYGKKRLGGGASAFTSSPWAYEGKVFCQSEDGETFVVQAGREFKVLGRNKLEEMALASPAIAGGSLFVRTQGKLWCLRAEK